MQNVHIQQKILCGRLIMLNNNLLEKEIALKDVVRLSKNAYVASTLKRITTCETRQEVGVITSQSITLLQQLLDGVLYSHHVQSSAIDVAVRIIQQYLCHWL